MTGLLKDLMSDKAEHAGAPHLDLDAIVADGDKRVRRRRVVTGAGVAAAAAAVIAARRRRPRRSSTPASRDPVATSPIGDRTSASSQPTYAVGSTIHYGDHVDRRRAADDRRTRADRRGFVFVIDRRRRLLHRRRRTEPIGPWPAVGGTHARGRRPVRRVGRSAAEDAPELVVYNTADRRPRCCAPARPALRRDQTRRLQPDGAVRDGRIAAATGTTAPAWSSPTCRR